jgi:DNA-binding response OmpR family regulator
MRILIVDDEPKTAACTRKGLTEHGFVVGVAVRRLRAKIDDPFERKLLRTIRGVGCVLEEPAA